MKTRVHRGKYRCEWVRMGPYGCVGAQESWGDTKTMYERTKRVVQALICALWPGKFPRASCLAKQKQKGHGRVWVDAQGLTFMRWDVWTRGTGKKGETRACFVCFGHVLHACSTEKKTTNWQGWLRASERIQGGECLGIERFAGRLY